MGSFGPQALRKASPSPPSRPQVAAPLLVAALQHLNTTLSPLPPAARLQHGPLALAQLLHKLPVAAITTTIADQTLALLTHLAGAGPWTAGTGTALLPPVGRLLDWARRDANYSRDAVGALRACSKALAQGMREGQQLRAPAPAACAAAGGCAVRLAQHRDNPVQLLCEDPTGYCPDRALFRYPNGESLLLPHEVYSVTDVMLHRLVCPHCSVAGPPKLSLVVHCHPPPPFFVVAVLEHYCSCLLTDDGGW